MHHNTDEFLGVDVGSAKIGIARGSALARLAQPLKTIAARDSLDELLVLASESRADGIVVGLPRNLRGEETGQTKYVRDWVKSAKNHIKLPFFWQDEALTSQVANKRSRDNTSDEHSLAAAIVLQDFLDTPEADRVRC